MNRLIAIALPVGPRFVAELDAAFDDGDAVLPVDVRLGDEARTALLAAMAPAALVVRPGERIALEGARPVEEGDALVMATSGTTGEPKGVVLTHDAVAASARATSSRLGVDAGRDRWWACLPVAHIGGLSVVLRSRTEKVPFDAGPFSEKGAAAALGRGATLVSLVPTALRRLEPEIAAGFRRIVLGGQAPPEELPANVVTTYGLTETGSGVVYDGWPLDGVEVRVAPGGEISLRCPMLLRCYRDGTVPLGPGGWLRTGDSGHFGADGRLHVDGRLSEMVITGGENVWPAPVEDVLRRHPGVADVGVAGRPDPEWGEVVVAVVAPSDPGAPPDLLELRALVRDQLAAYCAPRDLVLVETVPRTAIGKLRRAELARLARLSCPTAAEGPGA